MSFFINETEQKTYDYLNSPWHISCHLWFNSKFKKKKRKKNRKRKVKWQSNSMCYIVFVNYNILVRLTNELFVCISMGHKIEFAEQYVIFFFRLFDSNLLVTGSVFNAFSILVWMCLGRWAKFEWVFLFDISVSIEEIYVNFFFFAFSDQLTPKYSFGLNTTQKSLVSNWLIFAYGFASKNWKIITIITNRNKKPINNMSYFTS